MLSSKKRKAGDGPRVNDTKESFEGTKKPKGEKVLSICPGDLVRVEFVIAKKKKIVECKVQKVTTLNLQLLEEDFRNDAYAIECLSVSANDDDNDLIGVAKVGTFFLAGNRQIKEKFCELEKQWIICIHDNDAENDTVGDQQKTCTNEYHSTNLGKIEPWMCEDCCYDCTCAFEEECGCLNGSDLGEKYCCDCVEWLRMTCPSHGKMNEAKYGCPDGKCLVKVKIGFTRSRSALTFGEYFPAYQCYIAPIPRGLEGQINSYDEATFVECKCKWKYGERLGMEQCDFHRCALLPTKKIETQVSYLLKACFNSNAPTSNYWEGEHSGQYDAYRKLPILSIETSPGVRKGIGHVMLRRSIVHRRGKDGPLDVDLIQIVLPETHRRKGHATAFVRTLVAVCKLFKRGVYLELCSSHMIAVGKKLVAEGLFTVASQGIGTMSFLSTCDFRM